MIYELDDTDLLKWFKEQTTPTGIIHQCNCFCTMGGGIARQIVLEYPEAEKADKKTTRGDKKKMSSFSTAVPTGSPYNRIYNLYSQYHFGAIGYEYMVDRHTSYDAMVEGLIKISCDAISDGITKIGVPYNIGCGLGGGDWAVVKGILSSVFDKTVNSIDLYICQYEPK